MPLSDATIIMEPRFVIWGGPVDARALALFGSNQVGRVEVEQWQTLSRTVFRVDLEVANLITQVAPSYGAGIARLLTNWGLSGADALDVPAPRVEDVQRAKMQAMRASFDSGRFALLDFDEEGEVEITEPPPPPPAPLPPPPNWDGVSRYESETAEVELQRVWLGAGDSFIFQAQRTGAYRILASE